MNQYKVGKIVKCNITGIEKYGIFVSLDNFYSGLIHISEISNDFVRDPSYFGEVGETIYAKVLEVDEQTNHVKLSIKDINYRISKKRKSKIKERKELLKEKKEELKEEKKLEKEQKKAESRKQTNHWQGLSKDFASPSKLFGLAICLGRTWERLGLFLR